MDFSPGRHFGFSRGPPCLSPALTSLRSHENCGEKIVDCSPDCFEVVDLGRMSLRKPYDALKTRSEISLKAAASYKIDDTRVAAKSRCAI
jgi:hypothetical protein